MKVIWVRGKLTLKSVRTRKMWTRWNEGKSNTVATRDGRRRRRSTTRLYGPPETCDQAGLRMLRNAASVGDNDISGFITYVKLGCITTGEFATLGGRNREACAWRTWACLHFLRRSATVINYYTRASTISANCSRARPRTWYGQHGPKSVATGTFPSSRSRHRTCGQAHARD